VNEDWGSADVQAVAWINETLADDLRVSMDEFMAEIDPNDGGDSWISTDEREFFRALASECIEHTLTRIGIRDGAPHRGGVGVDWKNSSWEEDGVDIQEFNIVPVRHSQIRDCTSAFGNDCEEVPVIPDENRDCDTDIAASQGVDECRIKLWLNATVIIHGFFDSSNFTLVLNASNMTGAELDFTFLVQPYISTFALIPQVEPQVLSNGECEVEFRPGHIGGVEHQCEVAAVKKAMDNHRRVQP
jgi:hypothetical protein